MFEVEVCLHVHHREFVIVDGIPNFLTQDHTFTTLINKLVVNWMFEVEVCLHVHHREFVIVDGIPNFLDSCKSGKGVFSKSDVGDSIIAVFSTYSLRFREVGELGKVEPTNGQTSTVHSITITFRPNPVAHLPPYLEGVVLAFELERFVLVTVRKF